MFVLILFDSSSTQVRERYIAPQSLYCCINDEEEIARMKTRRKIKIKIKEERRLLKTIKILAQLSSNLYSHSALLGVIKLFSNI